MNEKRVLYKIKELDKAILKTFISDNLCDDKKIDTSIVLAPTQMKIIEYILSNKGKDIFQKDLEEVLNISRATISGILQTMEKKELIKRVSDSIDTRTKKIILNNKAEKMFNIHKKKLDLLETIIKKDITEDEIEFFCTIINHMKNNVENTFKDIKER